LLVRAYFRQYAGVPSVCWERIIIGFIVATTRGLFFFLALYFIRDIHMGVSVAGIALACYGAGAALGSYISGKLSDSISPNKVCIVSLILNGVTLFFLANSTHIHILIALVFLWGIFGHGFLIANYTWILQRTRLDEAERLKTLNILYAAFNLGVFITAGIVSLSDIYGGFKPIFMVFGAILLLTAAYLFVRSKHHHCISTVDITQNHTNMSLSENAVNPNVSNKMLFWFCVICLFFVSLIVTQNGAVYTFYLDQHFTALKTIGVSAIFAINPILIVLFQTPLVNLFRSKNKLVMIGIGSILMGVGMVILPFSSLVIFAVISVIVYTIGQMIFTTICELVLYQSSKPGKKGQALGTFRVIYALSMIVGPAMAGVIYHRYGGDMVWYICGFIGVIFLVACYVMRKHYKMTERTGLPRIRSQ